MKRVCCSVVVACVGLGPLSSRLFAASEDLPSRRGEFAVGSPDVSIPDPGLESAIREALQKPTGSLTRDDLLGLTTLDAGRRNITNLEGLEAARNLVSLDLESNHLTHADIPRELTRLAVLDLRFNFLDACSLPGELANLSSVTLEGNGLTRFSVPSSLAALQSLDLENNQITNVDLPPNLERLASLDLSFNALAVWAIPDGLRHLTTLNLAGNLLGKFPYPLAIRMETPQRAASGDVELAVTGPPGVYAILGSTALATWSQAGQATNQVGRVSFMDTSSPFAAARYFRAAQGAGP